MNSRRSSLHRRTDHLESVRLPADVLGRGRRSSGQIARCSGLDLPSVLKFGALAWGGPAAQIAMIKHECVDEEGSVSEESFKETLAVFQILPGPEAHELCVYFGRVRGGGLGGFLAGRAKQQ